MIFKQSDEGSHQHTQTWLLTTMLGNVLPRRSIELTETTRSMTFDYSVVMRFHNDYRHEDYHLDEERERWEIGKQRNTNQTDGFIYLRTFKRKSM